MFPPNRSHSAIGANTRTTMAMVKSCSVNETTAFSNVARRALSERK